MVCQEKTHTMQNAENGRVNPKFKDIRFTILCIMITIFMINRTL